MARPQPPDSGSFTGPNTSANRNSNSYAGLPVTYTRSNAEPNSYAICYSVNTSDNHTFGQ
jgi:hypothetical protein